MRCFQILPTLLLLLGVTGLPATAQAQSEIPADPSATFKTLIPHLNAIPRPKVYKERKPPSKGRFSFLASLVSLTL